MSMKVNLSLELELELFQLEETEPAGRQAQELNAQMYVWKTSGRENWLERGFSITDVLGIVILPHGLPDVIDMPDDELDEDDEDDD